MLKKVLLCAILFSISLASAQQRVGDRIKLPPTKIPVVVVTIKPVHSLVSGVMADVAEPKLLFDTPKSPHGIQLTPSMVKTLESADVVVWIGPTYETSLAETISKLPKHIKIVTLVNLRGMEVYPFRSGKSWGGDHDCTGHAHHHRKSHRKRGQHDCDRGVPLENLNVDGHIWLDTRNARKITVSITDLLQEIDLDHAPKYYENCLAVIDRIDDLTEDIQEKISPVAGMPYVVMHDAYQYYDKQFGTRAVGAIRPKAHLAPSVKHVMELGWVIEDEHCGDVRCAFYEPQFGKNAEFIKLLEAYDMKVGCLDPIGINDKPGVDAYFSMMWRLTTNLACCLWQ